MLIRNSRFIRAETAKITCEYADKNGNQTGNILPCIFKDIVLTEIPRSAKLEVTALGIYEPRVNGQRVGDSYFAPGWTDYNKLIYTQSYDLTEFLRPGKNRFGVTLGDGWFAGNLSLCRKTTYGDRQPEVAMVLTLFYEDERTEHIYSDDSFRFYESDIRYADFYMGTLIDRRFLTSTDIIDPAGPEGYRVVQGDGTSAEIAEDYEMPIREIERIKPASITAADSGKMIVDFGQNFVGVISLKVSAEPGGSVIVRHGEMLDFDGSLYTENLRGAKSIDTFFCSGKGIESFCPSFTFHGFRYAEISLQNVKVIDIEGVVLMTDLPADGSFECGSPLVSKLYSNIIWGLKGNFVDLPTDCPQRDERMGWAGDAQVFCRTAMYNYDCRDFYRKYMRNLRDTINNEGAPYDLAPYVAGLSHGTAAWADAIIVIPYQHYLFYADKSVIYENLDAMEGWIRYQLNTSSDYCRPSFGYGDWLSVRLDETPKDLLGTAYFAHTSRLLSYLCGEIGETAKSEYYFDLYKKVSDAFVRHYFDENGRTESDSQCSYLVALGFELVQSDFADKVAQSLKASILRDDSHLTCGFVGISLLLPVLSKLGMNDLAYTILLNETYPSWGFSIANGATTIWERWNSFTPDKGFGDAAMNSFNHYSLGSCGEWFAGYMCGILPEEEAPGLAQINIAPQPDPLQRIQTAGARYKSAYGDIVSSWSIVNSNITFFITVPEGINANLIYGGKITVLDPGSTVITVPFCRTL